MLAVLPVRARSSRSSTVNPERRTKLRSEEEKISTGGKTRSGQRRPGKRSRALAWALQTQKIGFG
jgi:hypothetical protein